MQQVLSAVGKRARADAVWLLSSLLKVSQAELLLEGKRALTVAELRTWRSWWRRRGRGEPLQYVAGFAPFYGRELAVSRAVLIPRPETECLVELSLGLLGESSGARVLDIGTGSGAIALTLKLERPDLEVAASDISSAALAIARKNAKALGADLRLEKHDLFSPALRKERWDLVVSNPPYLEFGRDHIAANVRQWEPRMALEPALVSGKGISATRAAWCAERILLACELCPPAYTALELSPRVAIFLERRWKKRASVKRVWREADLAGRKRFLLISWKEQLTQEEDSHG